MGSTRRRAASDDGAVARIVVGVDGSEPSRRALVWAADEAARRGDDLEVVHAWSFLDQPGATFDAHYGEAEARQWLAHFVTEVLGADAGGRVTLTTVCDTPAAAVLGRARGAALVVLGTHGRGYVAGAVLGSVSRHVVHHAPCAVALIPAR